VVAADPCGRPNPALGAAAGRAGGRGLLDATDPDGLVALVSDVHRRCAEPFWLRPGPRVAPGAVAGLPGDRDRGVEAVVVAAPVPGAAAVPGAAGGPAPDGLADTVRAWAAAGSWSVLAQVTSRAEAEAAVAAGAHGLVASGCEAGGRVGTTEAFVLFQQVVDLGVPVWSRGGIGLHTAAAVVAGGGAGVVLDGQLGLVREGGLGHDARLALGAMDGSETRVVGGHRIYTRPDLPAAGLTDDVPPAEVAARLGADLTADLVPFGQDGGFAQGLARRFATVGGVVQAVRAAVTDHLAAAAAAPPLAPGAGVAGPHGTRYPIAQGPMTRVSDRAAFAAAVAEGGGLPFLALALLPAAEVRALLTETAERLGDRPWGVGVLGFVPADLRAEQLEVVHEIAPPVALIAGGRPSQAAPLEAAGISTYLHVPSPGLLDRFLKDGARKFVFEGRECGGHVGPRSSFALWDAQIERLLRVDDPENLQILLAGGIHDARSAAMAAAACAPLAARGAKVGVLMGTAYLFTEEAVAGGAIQPAFQDVAVHCDTTVLLETAPGHATRCVETDFVRAFASRKAELEAEGVDPKARWAELETLNLGRLRIASKGIVRDDSGLVTVDPDHQRREGMYMIGEVATLRHEVTTVAALHAEVSEGSAAVATGTADGPPVPRLSVREPEHRPDPLDVAIIGMDAFFPGAVGAEEFWAEIVAGTDAVTEVPAGRWDVDRYYDADAFTRNAGRKTPSKWGGFLRRIGFDPLRYGIPPASLAAIEPVQLLSLEVAARALADAGYAEREFDRSKASVIFGTESGNELGGAYGVRAFLPQLFGEIPPALEDWLPSLTEDSFPGVLANVIAGRIANRLDLGGVNYTVDAACASSLAALDAACKELRLGTSDLVLAGGADLHNGLNDYLLFASVHALSPTGRCRTFDASADGIALGEGVACVVLKRRVDAERDGDRIYAVIDAVAGSSDGRHLGLTAPRKEGQQRAVHRALAQAGHAPTSIGLLEAHGTGTVVGDRTEMATLTEVFAEAGVEPGATVLGSVKSQIGHTKCAAGLAGLIKVAKAVHHGVLPPTVNLVEPNPYYDAETSPFRFLHQARPWAAATRRAGVSAFGFGGTNFHAVVSSYDGGDRPAHGAVQWPAELFLVRGATAADADRALDQLASTVAAVLDSDPDGQRHPLRDLAHAVCRAGTGPVRAAFVAASLTELATAVDTARAGTADAGAGVFLADAERAADAQAPTVGFLYPGQGSQRPGMLADLFVTFGGLDDLLRLGERWAPQLFPPAAFTREERAAQHEAITATDVAQPTLGIASLALTRLLGRLGVRPAAAGGHSYGELAALAAAGSFDDATLLELSAARGGSILEAVARSGGDPGTMAAVALSREELAERLAAWPDLVLANHNGPRQVVLSGPTASVHEAVAALQADGVTAKVLPVACAFHSPLIAEAGELLAARLAELPVAAPSFPVWSNVTAEPYPAGDATAVARLLTEQVTAGVRFVEQVESMYAAGVRVFVEAGPGRVLTQQVGKILGDRPHAMVACDVAGEPGVRRFLAAVAQLATLGVPVEPAALFEGRSTPPDLHALPVPAPNWQVDGALVCTAAGVPLPNSLQPAHLLPSLDFGAHAMTTGPDDPSGVVLEYLRSVRQIVAAERDVMLRYLGSAVPASATFDDYAGIIEGAAQPALGAATVNGTQVSGTQVNGAHGNGAQVNGAQVNGAQVDGAHANGSGADGPDPAVLTGAQLLHEVQAIVSERTGYPVEMLDPDLDLEADLSIDSIKRIEIVGELAERIGLAGLDESAVDEEMVEELAQHKSLRAIVEWIEALTTGEASPVTAESVAAAHAAHEPEHAHGPLPPVAQRFEVHTTLLGPAVARGDLHGATAGVVVGHAALTDAVVAALTARGAATARVERGAPVPTRTELPTGEVVVDLADHGAATARVERDGSVPTRAELLAGFDVVVDLTATAGDPSVDARSVFADLQPALLGATRRALAVTVPVHADGTPTGIPGLMRALARERHDALVRSVEVEPADLEGDLVPLAEILIDELLDLDAPAALSWAGGERAARVVGEPRDLAVPGELGLGPDAVVVITGGARGITARVAEGLARANPCRLVLVGRSMLPERDEDPRTAGAGDRQAIRRALLEIGDLRTPSEIEAACNRIEADREMRATLATLRSFGAEVEYVSLDVRDPRFGELLDELRDRHGRLDGVIHGAGVLDDHFLRDKTLAGFDRVFGTKLDGARAILDRQAGMRFVVLFGSVSGVFGNKGQADYAAANDALDTLARTRDGRHDCRVISLDWGPWGGGGMVSAELEREYARRGIGLVDPADGVMALLHEVAAGSGPSQLVVMRGTPEAFAPPIDHTPASDDLVGGPRA
jgi:acyl transferase domain-containing protein/NAD(P)H-dependent flavin oxidoreductase YrpB (nitropropane dioxygenase family)/NADP-dependent 3-hydroxy acid dehydrogenase YdfG